MFFKGVSGARGWLAVTVRVLSDALRLKRLGSARVRRVRFFYGMLFATTRP